MQEADEVAAAAVEYDPGAHSEGHSEPSPIDEEKLPASQSMQEDEEIAAITVEYCPD